MKDCPYRDEDQTEKTVGCKLQPRFWCARDYSELKEWEEKRPERVRMKAVGE
tara:strand:- start:367 stop:522 length:156 start_codon:yes stop_codon:yes gene_type:complete